MKRPILVLLSAFVAAEVAAIAAPMLAPGLSARYLFPLYYRRGRPTRWGRWNNAAMARLVSTGVLPEKWPGDPVCGPASLEVVGRRSGKPRANMVTWVEYEGGRYFVSMLGPQSDWVRNIRAVGGEAVLRRRGREPVRLEEVPVEESAPIIRQWYRRTWQSTLHHLGLQPDADMAEFERIAPHHPVYRIVAQPEEEPA
jgi:deazaflavin-dependent oxidoreductase (nitroreductase family)